MLLLFSCDTDDFRDNDQQENKLTIPQPKVQYKRGNQVSQKAVNFIKMKTNNAFTIMQRKGTVMFSQNSFLNKSTELGIIDTSKEIVVHNETTTKHTFKVISPYQDSTTVINVIIVEKGDTTYEYFLKYTFNGEIPYNEDKTAVDFSQFSGTIETFDNNGEIIGSISVENSTIIDNTGNLTPCPTNDEPEPSDDTNTSNTGGSDANTDNSSGTNEDEQQQYGDTYYDNTSVGSGGELVDTNDDCGVSWAFTDCGCGPQFANGHRPSGNACCRGSMMVMVDCNGVVQRNNTYDTPFTKRDTLDPCDDGDVGVILDVDDDCDTSKDDLQKIFPNMSDDDATLLAKLINEKGTDFGIDTQEKLWHFLSQAGHETGGFTTLNVTENLNYTTASRIPKSYSSMFTMDTIANPTKKYAPDYTGDAEKLANVAYCCKYSNGDENSGDGWKYRGRGIMQLTWKSNYTEFKTWYNNKYDPDIDFVTTPEHIATNDTLAILSGMWFFKDKVLDKIDIDSTTTVSKITRKINGKRKKGLKDRKKRFKKAKDSITCIE